MRCISSVYLRFLAHSNNSRAPPHRVATYAEGLMKLRFFSLLIFFGLLLTGASFADSITVNQPQYFDNYASSYGWAESWSYINAGTAINLGYAEFSNNTPSFIAGETYSWSTNSYNEIWGYLFTSVFPTKTDTWTGNWSGWDYPYNGIKG